MSENKEPNGGVQPQPYCVNIFPADSTGCDFYRNFAPQTTIEHCIGNITFNVCRKFMVDSNFFRGSNVSILQRQVNNAQREYYLRYIMPMSRQWGSWIVYNIDDCIYKDDIPRYNKAWEAYQSDEFMSNIKQMLNESDFVLVTTDELGKYYTDRFGVAEDNIIVIPNFIPHWWMGHCFNLEKKVGEYREFVEKRHKPRIGLIGAPSHYDVCNKNVENDITALLPYIKKTVKEYQWVIFGSEIPELNEYVSRGEIEFHNGIDILHYPDMLNNLALQYVVAPLIDNLFNRCKSNIKLTESWALGFGCAAQDICCYNKYTDDVFSNDESLDAILKRDLASEEAFTTKIKDNFSKMSNWWLENNLNQWLNLYRLRQKPLILNYDRSKQAVSASQKPTHALKDSAIAVPEGVVLPNTSAK